MRKYVGMNFCDWCKLDPDDDRRINYTLFGTWDGIEGQRAEFTSDDEVEPIVMHRIRNACISTVKLIDNEWHVTLVY